MKKLIFISLVFVVSKAYADPKEFLFQQRQLKLSKDETSTAVAGAYQQKIDHNSNADTSTFTQRYWYDSTYARGVNAPTLINICGEGECGPYYLGGTMAAHAKKLGAHLVALEHRYYGKSQPFGDLSTENLKYLTIDQALKDMVAFKKFVQEKLKFNGKWIAVGGSYAGAMAAYLRANYPNEFVGGLSSSGPVQADLNFDEYDRHVARMAGPECLSAVKKVVSAVENLVATPEGFEKAKAIFNAAPLKDVDDFLYLVADTAAAAVQYGMREKFCKLVQAEGLIGYGKAADLVAELFGNLVGMSAQAAEEISLDSASGSIGMRQWFYQSCTEFGYWQNAYGDSAESSRSSRINAKYHANVCDRLFGMKDSAAVEATNAKYYFPLLASPVSNIFFTNGSEDPWMNLSIVEKTFPHLDVMVMQGAAHCDDLGPNGTNSQIPLAKSMFLELAAGWLK